MIWMFLLLFANEATEFRAQEEAWRAQRNETMKAPDSWFGLVGLYWLEEGANPFGSDPSLRIHLPRFSTVAHAGTIYLENGKVRYEMERAQRGVMNGETQNSGTLVPDDPDSVLSHNNLRMFVIKRGDRYALRVRDLRSPALKDFESLTYYKPRKSYVIEGRFEPYENPEYISVVTVIDSHVEYLVPGVIKFKIDDQELELLPFLSSPDSEEYFILFKDNTAGKSTYPGGRYLYTPIADENGIVTLNFNRAINPPCAYTKYATCPLPPAENWLDATIEAGELRYDTDTPF